MLDLEELAPSSMAWAVQVSQRLRTATVMRLLPERFALASILSLAGVRRLPWLYAVYEILILEIVMPSDLIH